MRVNRRQVMIGAGALAAMPAWAKSGAGGQPEALAVRIDPGHRLGALRPNWKAAGSDRAATALRAQWHEDLALVRDAADIRTIRFHGLFDDEMGVLRSPLSGAPEANFQLVDEAYDRMLDAGVRPYVELGFMPGALASGPDTVMSYKGNVTPPRDMGEWAAFIGAFARHLVGRYGIDEVAQWHFEVWNEPNLGPFWTGGQAGYFALYEATARALKAVDARLRVGGPATAQTAWIGDFLGFCAARQLPVDFVSTHCYPADPQEALFGPGAAPVPAEWVIPRAAARVRAAIDATPFRGAPLHLSEWSAESPAFIAHTVAQCLGTVDLMSYWTFSGIFEELGVARTPFGDGDFTFGMTGLRGIPKPALHAFAMLARLSGERVGASGPGLATLGADGTLRALVWNLGSGGATSGIPGITAGTASGTLRTVTLATGRPGAPARVTAIDPVRGSAREAWRAMGSPATPTRAQLAELRRAAAMPTARTMTSGADGTLAIALPADGLALVEIAA